MFGWLGVTVHVLPKYHTKLVREGIIYSWEFSKELYCCLPICQKRSKENFWTNGRESLSRKNLTTEKNWWFSNRAHGYLCLYYHLRYNKDGKNNRNQGEKIQPQQIEQLVKDFKTHCCALDFEVKFIVKKEKEEKMHQLLSESSWNMCTTVCLAVIFGKQQQIFWSFLCCLSENVIEHQNHYLGTYLHGKVLLLFLLE